MGVWSRAVLFDYPHIYVIFHVSMTFTSKCISNQILLDIFIRQLMETNSYENGNTY